MVNTFIFWIVYPVLLVLSMLVIVLMPQLRNHPLSLLFYLLLVGGPELYYLARYCRPYFHWFFYSKRTVIGEIRSALLAYLLFLIAGVVVNTVLLSSVFIVLIALIFPLVAAAIAFGTELTKYRRQQ